MAPWNWQSSCTNCIFYIIQEVGAELECLFKGLFAFAASYGCKETYAIPWKSCWKEQREFIGEEFTKTHLFWLQKHLKLKFLCTTSQGRHTEPSLELPLFPLPPTFFSLPSQLTDPAQIAHQDFNQWIVHAVFWWKLATTNFKNRENNLLWPILNAQEIKQCMVSTKLTNNPRPSTLQNSAAIQFILFGIGPWPPVLHKLLIPEPQPHNPTILHAEEGL